MYSQQAYWLQQPQLPPPAPGQPCDRWLPPCLHRPHSLQGELLARIFSLLSPVHLAPVERVSQRCRAVGELSTGWRGACSS